MNRKKIIVLLATLMLFSPIATASVGTVAGTTVVTDSCLYSLINNGTAVEITGFNGTGTSITIPSVLAGEPVISIGDRAFCNCTSVATVTIPNSVLRIGTEAFRNCYSLTTLSIPNSVVNIGDSAFCDVGLHSIVIPNSLRTIGDNLFLDCYSLTSVTIPISITSIGNYSFGNCYQLSSVTIPKSVTSIGVGAFYSCGLHVVVIPESINKIEDRCFQGCYALTSVTMPVSVTSIGNYSFNNCYSLTSVAIPSNVSSLGEYLFGNCYSLFSATISPAVTTTGAGAFFNCYDLASITFDGNAPSMGGSWKTGCCENMTVYYYQGAIGFTNLSWNGVKVCEMPSPYAPQNLSAVPGDGSVKLSWGAPSGFKGMTSIGYLVYGNGTKVEKVVGNTVKISNLTNGMSYNFTVTFPDTKGNLRNSTSIMVRMPTLDVAVDGVACDVAGKPIANATVTLGNYTAVATNEYGFFMFLGVKMGNYSLTVSKDGYSPITQNVTANSSKNVNLDSMVLQVIVPSSDSGSGSGDMTWIIIIVAAIGVGGFLVYFFFLRKR